MGANGINTQINTHPSTKLISTRNKYQRKQDVLCKTNFKDRAQRCVKQVRRTTRESWGKENKNLENRKNAN